MKPVKNHYYIYVNGELEIIFCDYKDFVETFSDLKNKHGELVTYETLEANYVMDGDYSKTEREVMEDFFDTFLDKE